MKHRLWGIPTYALARFAGHLCRDTERLWLQSSSDSADYAARANSYACADSVPWINKLDDVENAVVYIEVDGRIVPLGEAGAASDGAVARGSS